MTDLMPFSLPKPLPTISDEGSEENMSDDPESCFPELLARDLEISSSIFEAKNMTSGTPCKTLIHEEKTKQRTLSCPGRLLTSPYQTASLRVQTLGAIEERDSVVSFLSPGDYGTEMISDGDSIHGSESSGVEGPSIRFRQQSIVTAATSLTSNSGSAPSPKEFMSDRHSRGHSWIDVDSDDDMMEAEDEELIAERHFALSPRPPSPVASEGPFSIMENLQDLPRSQTVPPRSSHAMSSGSLSRQNSLRSSDIPRRRASVSCSITPSNTFTTQESFGPRPTSNCRKKRLSLHLPSHARYLYQVEPYPEISPPPDKMGGFDAELGDQYEDDSIFDGHFRPLQRPNTVYIQTTPPPSPLPSVQTWLDRARPSFDSQRPVDDLVKAVPLPPDIIETLRVSIVCFPETMLLTSSLTIETIRAYSKKVRHTSTDGWRESIGSMPPHNHRRSLWKKVVSHGRESLHTYLHRGQLHNDIVAGDETPRDHNAYPDAWTSLRHVFGTCSDYICDALYAHIVAYNYISRVPRSQTPSSPRISISSSKRSQSDDIPKKAASLLGIDSPQRPFQTNPPMSRIAKKFSIPLTRGFAKDEMTVGSGTSAAQDNATRNIEAGLLRCIMRLIATAKMMAEGGGGEERLMEIEPQELDMIVVRSLCEIVRISEEAIVTVG
ncbi:hypothetical protein BGZ63DRAFT_39743 [Mariannaea sp. PMI_226]|nr:hypothetical protein BGZ63DRAFT_39743 [Mariannaea sp. PMI_226]